MGRENRYPGLRQKDGVWWIDVQNKRFGRIYESTGCSKEHAELAQAYYLARTRKALEDRIFGVRPTRTFREAATKHLVEETGRLKSLGVDAWALEHWAVPKIGDLALVNVHDGTLEPMKAAMVEAGRKQKTVNLVLQVIRKILNKAARKWRDDSGKTWLETAPLISIDAPTDARPPYPLSWEEERKLLLPELPGHLQKMSMFALSVGARDEEICGLRWVWERRIPELDAEFKVSVFVLPDSKNGTPRLLVLNKAAMRIVESCRGEHPEYVFSYRPAVKDGEPRRILTMNNSAWRKARTRAAVRYKQELGMEAPTGFKDLHVHDLRHTFGRRLRAAGVTSEDRADLLGHVDGNMTTHYSAAEIGQLLSAVRKLEGSVASTPTMLRIQSA